MAPEIDDGAHLLVVRRTDLLAGPAGGAGPDGLFRDDAADEGRRRRLPGFAAAGLGDVGAVDGRSGVFRGSRFEQRRTCLQQLLLRTQDQLPGREGLAAGLGRAGDVAAAAPRAGIGVQQLLPGEVPDLRPPDRGGVVQIHRPQGPLGGQVPEGDVGEDEERVEMLGAGRVDHRGEQYQVVEPPEAVEHRRQAARGDTGVLEGARQGHADGWPGVLDTARGIAEALEKIVQHHHGDHDREEYGLDHLLAGGLLPLQPRRFDDVAFHDGPDHRQRG